MISVGMLKDVWAFRDFIFANVKRDFQLRYLNTQFGAIWTVLQPLSMILIYTIIFAELMKPSLPGHQTKFAYSIYLCSGVLTWGFFSDLLMGAVGIFISNSNILKKIAFPKLCLPITLVLTNLINFGIIMLIFLLFLLLVGHFSVLPTLAAIPVILILIAFTSGLGILLGTINVFYRDVEKLTGIILNFWFWLTPIVYSAKTLPEFAKKILIFNPIYPIIRAMQTIFLERTYPDWISLIYPLILSLILVFLGMYSFWKLGGEIVDEL